MSAKSKQILAEIHRLLFKRYGPQLGWATESSFETMVGILLAQNISWQKVEPVLADLKRGNGLSVEALLGLGAAGLAERLGPGKASHPKARRLLSFLAILERDYGGDILRMGAEPVAKLRERLLAIKGIGPETADAILLYALGHPVFVVDAHAYRVFTRHALAAEEEGYEELQEIASGGLEPQAERYREFRALLAKVGREHCRPQERCEACPLKGVNW